MTDRPASRGGWMMLVAAWAIVGGAVMAWITLTPPISLRLQLKVAQFWALEACLLAGIAAAWLISREVGRLIGREHLGRMAILAGTALALTLFVAPHTSRIFYDEQIYQSIGHNLADLRLAQMCLDGNVQYGRLECTAGEYNKQPYAYPHLLSVIYRVAGVQPSAAYALNAAAMAVTVAGVYFIVLLLFHEASAALFAGLILALTPHQILWSATAAVEPLASMACVLAIAAVALFARVGTTASLFAAGIATVYAVQFRPESFLIAGVVAVLLLLLAPGELKQRRLWWVALACFALLSVHLAHLASVRHENWGATAARFSLAYVGPNFDVNGRFYVADERFPVVYTLLALAGLAAAGAAALRVAMALYFALFFAVSLIFYAGSYNYGADVRYSVMTYPPLAILAGLGAGWLSAAVGRRLPFAAGGSVVIVGLVFQFLWYAPLVRATTREAWAARADVEFAQSVAPELPRNSLVLTHNPGMFHLWGVNASQMFLVVDNPAHVQFLMNRYPGGVYLHWNFWCNVADPAQQDMCRKVVDMVDGSVYREYREQDQRFAFVRIAAIRSARRHPPDDAQRQ